MEAAASERESEKLAVTDFDPLAFVDVNHPFQAVLPITSQAAPYALTRALAAQHDDDSVRVPRQPMSPPLQLLCPISPASCYSATAIAGRLEGHRLGSP